jgi:hypothetical protein
MSDLALAIQNNRRIEVLDRDPIPKGWTADLDGMIRNRPEDYLAIIDDLASGISVKAIAEKHHKARITIRTIRDRHPAAAESYSVALNRNLEDGIHLLTEMLIEKADDIPAGKLGLNIHLLHKTHELHSGRATSRTEHVSVASPEDLQSLFDQLPTADASVIYRETPTLIKVIE